MKNKNYESALPLASLQPHPYNATVYGPCKVTEDLELAASIQAHGILSPVVVTGKGCASPPGTILSGHRRVEQAKKLGIASVKVQVRTGLSEDEEKKTILIENVAANTGRKLSERQKFEHEEEIRRLDGRKQGARNDLKPTRICGDSDTIVAAQTGETANAVRARRAIFTSPLLTPQLEEAVETAKVPMTTAVSILREAAATRKTSGEVAAKSKLEADVTREIEKTNASGGRRRRGRRRKRVPLTARTRSTASTSPRVEPIVSGTGMAPEDIIKDARAARRLLQVCGPLTVPQSVTGVTPRTVGELYDWNERFETLHAPVVTAMDRLVDYGQTLKTLETAVGQLLSDAR